MSILSAIILGAVQGLTEFLPVSSSGHLVLLQKIFGISEPAMFFDTMVHAGTLLAVFVVLRRDIWAILRRPVQPLTGWLILATVPAVAAALLLGDAIEHAFESGQFLGFCFLATTALLVTAELLSRRAGPGLKKAEGLGWLDALVIGVLQAIAIAPGLSRSGATISGALSRKLDRDFAARFSFLMSIPAILGAVVLQVKDLAKGGAAADAANGGIAAGGISAAAVVAGSLSAAIVGFFAVKFMLKIIREKSLFGFAIYTAVLGTLVLVDQFATHLVF
ncbi:MAG: undecaprenyl-diphosphate phosphatase [Treponema sp.]|jgi:undecaprenyl-diphosphatase|nr:undecaprenyl-diphosphate phosphatase [Treponema sp.]